MDDPMGPELRWITVKLPEDEVQFVLANFGAFDPEGAQPGSTNGYVLWTDDIQATYEDWSAKGVEFSPSRPRSSSGEPRPSSTTPTATAGSSSNAHLRRNAITSPLVGAALVAAFDGMSLAPTPARATTRVAPTGDSRGD